MSNSYTITVLKSTVQIEPGKSGSASFTVTNKTGKAMTVRAEAVFVGQGKASWLVIDGEVIRDFSADGTQQYLVKISVPANAASGTYPFKLRAYSVDDPDEYFAESSVVEVTVPQGEAPEPKKKLNLITIAAVVASIVLAVVAILFGFQAKNLGKQLGEAEKQRGPQCLLYQEPDQVGSPLPINADHDLERFGDAWNDKISSITVPSNCTLVLFDSYGYTGSSKAFESSSLDLGDFNDRTSSAICACYSDIKTIVVDKKQCLMYEHGGRTGNFLPINADHDLEWFGDAWNDKISSITVPSNCTLVLFDSYGYTGSSKAFGSGSYNLTDFNDQTSSAICACSD